MANHLATTKRDDLAVTAPDLALAYLARLRSETSRLTMRSKLDCAARLLSGGDLDATAFPWASLTPAHVAALPSAMVGRGYAGATINATLAAVRGVLREAWRAGMLTADALARLVDVRPEPTASEPAGRGLDAGEVAALFAAADQSARGARDAALLALLYGLGLRRAEAVAVQVADVTDEGVKVRGKGRKVRTVPMANGAGAAVAAWLAVRGDAPGPLMVRINKGGRVSAHGLSGRAVAKILARLAEAAAVRPFTAHDLRRSYVGALLDVGADLATVQALAGHASPTTTARYDRRPAETRRRAAAMLHVPYRRRP